MGAAMDWGTLDEQQKELYWDAMQKNYGGVISLGKKPGLTQSFEMALMYEQVPSIDLKVMLF